MTSPIYRRAMMLAAAAMLVLAAVSVAAAQTRSRRPALDQQSTTKYRHAYEHGYLGGYNDGFSQGKADTGGERLRDFMQNDYYARADRTYEDHMGTLIEYQEGYRAGFELGYGDGYYGRPYSTTIPTNLGRVVTASINAQTGRRQRDDVAYRSGREGERHRTIGEDEQTRPAGEEEGRRPLERRSDRDIARDPDDSQVDDQIDNRPVGRAGNRGDNRPAARGGVPGGMQMKIRLNTRIHTKENREGDRFTATVLDPSTYEEAEIVGHIAKLKKSGNATGKTELSLAFDTITLRDGRTYAFDAQVERVYESETVKTTDEEGNVQTESRTKDTAVRTGGGAALGAIIGAIAGGGKGAAIGAVIGAGVGAGSVFIEEGKTLILEPGTEMLIKTAGPER